MNKNETRVLLYLVLILSSMVGMAWSAFAGIDGEKGNIIYNWRLWFLLPSACVLFFSILYANRIIYKSDVSISAGNKPDEGDEK